MIVYHSQLLFAMAVTTKSYGGKKVQDAEAVPVKPFLHGNNLQRVHRLTHLEPIRPPEECVPLKANLSKGSVFLQHNTQLLVFPEDGDTWRQSRSRAVKQLVRAVMCVLKPEALVLSCVCTSAQILLSALVPVVVKEKTNCNSI